MILIEQVIEIITTQKSKKFTIVRHYQLYNSLMPSNFEETPLKDFFSIRQIASIVMNSHAESIRFQLTKIGDQSGEFLSGT